MSLLPTILENGLTPDIIDETDPNDMYVGFFDFNAVTTPNHCAIKRITKVDGITTIKFPVGRFDFVFDWDKRATYTYRFRDFNE